MSHREDTILMGVYEPSNRTASAKQMLQEMRREAELPVMLSQHNADLVGAEVKLFTPTTGLTCFSSAHGVGYL